MTKDGVMKLVQYQQGYFANEWKRAVGESKETVIAATWMEAFKKFDDDTVLKSYQSALVSGKWERMPSIPQILSILGTEKGSYRCSLCNLPWDNGHGRLEGRKKGEVRCPNCNAILENPIGFSEAEDIDF